MQFVRAVITPGMVRHKANLRVAARKSCDIRPSRPHLYKKRKGGPATRPLQKMHGAGHPALTPALPKDIIYQRKISSLTIDNFKSEDGPKDHFRNHSS